MSSKLTKAEEETLNDLMQDERLDEVDRAVCVGAGVLGYYCHKALGDNPRRITTWMVTGAATSVLMAGLSVWGLKEAVKGIGEGVRYALSRER